MPFLQSTELRSEVHAYLPLRGLECDPLQVGGAQDHVHILSRTLQKDLPRRVDQESQNHTCGIDPGELTPFQGATVYWTVPGVETPG